MNDRVIPLKLCDTPKIGTVENGKVVCNTRIIRSSELQNYKEDQVIKVVLDETFLWTNILKSKPMWELIGLNALKQQKGCARR